MAKKPNKLGRIEGEPKVGFWTNAKIMAHNSLFVLVPVALVVAGVFGTLKYQDFINGVKAEGVAEFKVNHCDKFTNKDKTETWLECDE